MSIKLRTSYVGRAQKVLGQNIWCKYTSNSLFPELLEHVAAYYFCNADKDLDKDLEIVTRENLVEYYKTGKILLK